MKNWRRKTAFIYKIIIYSIYNFIASKTETNALAVQSEKRMVPQSDYGKYYQK